MSNNVLTPNNKCVKNIIKNNVLMIYDIILVYQLKQYVLLLCVIIKIVIDLKYYWREMKLREERDVFK